MMRALQTSCALAILAIGAGCANPINARTADRYRDAGGAAEQRGDFVQARIYYQRMFRNAEMGSLGPAAEASALYEWGRVSGYLGKTNDVEWAFPKVLELIDRARGKADDLRRLLWPNLPGIFTTWASMPGPFQCSMTPNRHCRVNRSRMPTRSALPGFSMTIPSR